tara:strand:- start:57 stop:353 length:297 start_codon:yes stop_codon:yes gene_type:complete
MEEHAFFLEIQRLSEEMDDVIKKYGMQDRIMSVSVIGLIDEDLMGNSRLQAIYSYSLDSKEELNSIIEFINSSWEQTDVEEGYKDIDDLLDGTGVGLE